MSNQTQPQPAEDELDPILDAMSAYYANRGKLGITKDEAKQQLRAWGLRERLDELKTVAPHFCDEPTNFVYYNNRIAELESQLKAEETTQ